MATIAESRRKVQLKCTVAPGGKCVTGAGLEYTLTGKDKQKFGRREFWGKEVIVNLDITQSRGSVSGGAAQVARSRKGDRAVIIQN